MARLCSFEINYNKRSFPALITIVNHQETVVCTVHFVERKIGFLEPGDKLVFCKKQGLQHPRKIPEVLSQELNRCMKELLTDLPAGRA